MINIPRNLVRSASQLTSTANRFATTLTPLGDAAQAVSSIQNVSALAQGLPAQAQGFYNNLTQQASALAGNAVAQLTQAQNIAGTIGNAVSNVSRIVANPLGSLGSALANGVSSVIDTSVIGNAANIAAGLSASQIASGIGQSGVTNFTPAEAAASRSTIANSRPYIPKSPLKDRYDFLRGQKVFNVLGDGPPGQGGGSGPRLGGGTGNIRGGTSSVPGAPSTGSAGSVLRGAPVDPTGVVGATPQIGYDVGQVDPGLAQAAGLIQQGNTPAAWSQEDVRSVEALREFNQDLGGGAAQARLSASERAYARSMGYLSASNSAAPVVNDANIAGGIS